MTIREKLIQQLSDLKYAGLSSVESRRLNEYLQEVSNTLARVYGHASWKPEKYQHETL